MSRSRNIKPGFFKNEDLSDMTPYTRLLFIGLWTLADREGRMEYRPRKIVAELFPYEQFVLEPCMNHLWAKQFLIMFYADGKRYIQINNWLKHQAPHHKEVASTIKPAEPENVVVNQESFDAWLMHESCMDYAQFKQVAPSPLIPDSLNLIPDSNKEPAPKGASRGIGLDAWLESIGEEEAIPAEDTIFAYAKKAGIPLDFLELSWNRFCEDMTERKTRKKDWRAHYRNAVKGNWYKIWWLDNDGVYQLTTVGKQAKAVLS